MIRDQTFYNIVLCTVLWCSVQYLHFLIYKRNFSLMLVNVGVVCITFCFVLLQWSSPPTSHHTDARMVILEAWDISGEEEILVSLWHCCVICAWHCCVICANYCGLTTSILFGALTFLCAVSIFGGETLLCAVSILFGDIL